MTAAPRPSLLDLPGERERERESERERERERQAVVWGLQTVQGSQDQGKMAKKMPYVVGYNWVKKKDLPWNKDKLLRVSCR